MKILHVISSLARELGGPSQSCPGMARAVAALGHDVRICTSKWDGAGKTVDAPSGQPVMRDGVSYYYYTMPTLRVMAFSPEMVRALPGLVDDVDIVHLHSLYLAHSWATGDISRRHGKPYIIRPHGTLDPYIFRRRRWRKRVVEVLFQNRVNRNAAAFHFSTRDEMERSAPYTAGRPGFVAPLGLDLSRFASTPPRGQFRARYPMIGDRPVVLFYSRLSFVKGLDILIPAFAKAVREGLDAVLVMAGPDFGMEAKARAWIAEHGLEDRCVFTGMLEGSDALSALNDADLFVLPSYSESFGMSVVEAMAAGLPVLISEHVKIWREVEADDAGMVKPNDVDAFAAGISELMGDAKRRQRMGANAKASVARRYTWDQVGRRLEEVYEAILAGRPFEAYGSGPELVAGDALAIGGSGASGL
jgi:glycosyltransferase involved in cell wall biosynthesis